MNILIVGHPASMEAATFVSFLYYFYITRQKLIIYIHCGSKLTSFTPGKPSIYVHYAIKIL